MILSLFAISSLSVFIAILHNGCIVHAGTSDNYFWLDITCLMLCKRWFAVLWLNSPTKVTDEIPDSGYFPLDSKFRDQNFANFSPGTKRRFRFRSHVKLSSKVWQQNRQDSQRWPSLQCQEWSTHQ